MEDLLNIQKQQSEETGELTRALDKANEIQDCRNKILEKFLEK